MRVNIDQLEPGCILSEDIFLRTTMPLMRKKTVLTEENIHILKTFLVETAAVETKLINGKPFKPSKTIVDEKEKKKKQDEKPVTKTVAEQPFIDRYLEAVQKYKQLFITWQSGIKVDIWAVRQLFLNVFTENRPSKYELSQLHHYGTKTDYHYYHAVSVAILSASLGEKLNLSSGDIIQLGISGLLADCGMSKVPPKILNKKGSLTESENKEIKKHPLYSYQMLKDLPGISQNALQGVLQHHERLDGSGYPMGYQVDVIHHYAKIISVCDMYHAMTTERHYRSKQLPFKVLEQLHKDEFGKLDPIIVEKFISIINTISIGSQVRLTNGYLAEVIYVDQKEQMRPLVRLENGEMLDLKSETNEYIAEVIKQ
ncbi:HD-GYP domain-containing protein [Texcoconibacillus texcoconensis]|uniref:HD-GYP domain-containing protein (C-di-GMP phosphodiesterase class II) n=1 Tax=Texcoconibacillus texcoconensis TaxID=1095777 RepID=A0A840QU31_9BACI|nr:HD-GYP domain-containing protein [Texcoconibacillus texcoconensis]MBB5174791.1 HD-GYP domain-containing protein (c-di-GMP phosphodiesterase class II) [Texcoconibacillus texcoconensis]